MTVVRTLAPAKVNLALEVLGRREDGYHEVDTVMTTLDLADRVVVRTREAGAGLEVVLRGRYARGIDAQDDLSGRAARALAEAAGREPDLRIEVEKRVPSPAGLGGGASDAAAVLRALDALWGLNWRVERLAEAGARLGSDVPFFVHGGTARCSGRGEVVEPLPDLRPVLRMLLLVPAIPAAPDKTRRRYAALHRHDFTDGGRSQRLARRIQRHAPPPTNDLVNVFEAVIERTETELVAQYSEFAAAAAGQPRFHLCGAGPAVYLLIREDAKAAELKRDFERAGAEVIEARTLSRAEAIRVTATE
jgi:4-diphosphocytidyl-2-C-methyl-D-erythritol kinase